MIWKMWASSSSRKLHWSSYFSISPSLLVFLLLTPLLLISLIACNLGPQKSLISSFSWKFLEITSPSKYHDHSTLNNVSDAILLLGDSKLLVSLILFSFFDVFIFILDESLTTKKKKKNDRSEKRQGVAATKPRLTKCGNATQKVQQIGEDGSRVSQNTTFDQGGC